MHLQQVQLLLLLSHQRWPLERERERELERELELELGLELELERELELRPQLPLQRQPRLRPLFLMKPLESELALELVLALTLASVWVSDRPQHPVLDPSVGPLRLEAPAPAALAGIYSTRRMTRHCWWTTCAGCSSFTPAPVYVCLILHGSLTPTPLRKPWLPSCTASTSLPGKSTPVVCTERHE